MIKLSRYPFQITVGDSALVNVELFLGHRMFRPN